MVSYYYNSSIEKKTLVYLMSKFLIENRLNKGLKVKILSSYYQKNSKKTYSLGKLQ